MIKGKDKRKDMLNQILPGLAVIVDHFNAKNKVKTRDAYKAVAKNMFGSKESFVLSVNGYVLETIKFYSSPRSLLLFLKLSFAYAIKNHKKTVPFLLGVRTMVARPPETTHVTVFS